MNSKRIERFGLPGWTKVFRTFLFALLPCPLLGESNTDYAYLGVQVTRLDPGISHQLGLPAGAHLQVLGVGAGSPAERSGIEIHDVLLRFDDQILINPEQLKTLVRMRNPGERVSLSLLRRTKPLALSVELTEAPDQAFEDSPPWQKEYDRSFDPFDPRSLLDREEDLRNFLFRGGSRGFGRQGSPWFSDPFADPGRKRDPVDDPLHGGGSEVSSFSYSSSSRQVMVSDEQGSLQWTERDGLRFLRVTDLQGVVVFDGPISTEEDLKKLPEPIALRLRALQESGQVPE